MRHSVAEIAVPKHSPGAVNPGRRPGWATRGIAPRNGWSRVGRASEGKSGAEVQSRGKDGKLHSRQTTLLGACLRLGACMLLGRRTRAMHLQARSRGALSPMTLTLLGRTLLGGCLRRTVRLRARSCGATNPASRVGGEGGNSTCRWDPGPTKMQAVGQSEREELVGIAWGERPV